MNIENLSKEHKKKKRENTEKIDIICLKKRSKNLKNMKKEDIIKQKSLLIIMNKIFF